MGKLFLCEGTKARNPFFIRCIEKNVYTMEELCFFFYHEIYFVEEFHDWAELAGWLKREMKMDSLAKEIQRLIVGYDTKNADGSVGFGDCALPFRRGIA